MVTITVSKLEIKVCPGFWNAKLKNCRLWQLPEKVLKRVLSQLVNCSNKEQHIYKARIITITKMYSRVSFYFAFGSVCRQIWVLFWTLQGICNLYATFGLWYGFHFLCHGFQWSLSSRWKKWPEYEILQVVRLFILLEIYIMSNINNYNY